MDAQPNFKFDPYLGYRATHQIYHEIQDPDIQRLIQKHQTQTGYISYTTSVESTYDAFEDKPCIEFNNHIIDKDLRVHHPSLLNNNDTVVAYYLDEQKYHIQHELEDSSLNSHAPSQPNKGLPQIAETMLKIRPAIEKH